jgi:hypothetical protein
MSGAISRQNDRKSQNGPNAAFSPRTALEQLPYIITLLLFDVEHDDGGLIACSAEVRCMRPIGGPATLLFKLCKGVKLPAGATSDVVYAVYLQ